MPPLLQDADCTGRSLGRTDLLRGRPYVSDRPLTNLRYCSQVTFREVFTGHGVNNNKSTGKYFNLLKNCSKMHKNMLSFIHIIDMTAKQPMSQHKGG